MGGKRARSWHGWRRRGGGHVSTVQAGPLANDGRLDEPTLAHVWHSISGRPISDDLLEWPPDLFALANVILERSEAFRFALAPASDWPPARFGDWPATVEHAGGQWSEWVDNGSGAIPDLVLEEWSVVRDG